MNKNQYYKKMLMHFLLASGLTLFEADASFAKTQVHKTLPASTVDSTVVITKHKIMSEKVKPAMTEAVEIAKETQQATLALQKKDNKAAASILQGVSTKLDGILAKNPGMKLVPANVEMDVQDFDGSNQDIANAISTVKDLLKDGKLQSARRILSGLASEVRATTVSIPMGTYPTAIKQIIPLINSGKIDQAAVDLNSALDNFVVETEVMPLPVLRAEELLTVAADLEHRDDLSKDENRAEIRKFTDAAKGQLERAQLLGYGNKNDYRDLNQEIDGIHKTLFTEQSAATWQKIKADLAQFKDRLKGLEDAVERIGHPAK